MATHRLLPSGEKVGEAGMRGVVPAGGIASGTPPRMVPSVANAARSQFPLIRPSLARTFGSATFSPRGEGDASSPHRRSETP